MHVNSFGVHMAGGAAGTSSISQNLAEVLILLTRRHIAFELALHLSAYSGLASLEAVQPSVISVRHKESCLIFRPFHYLCVCRNTE